MRDPNAVALSKPPQMRKDTLMANQMNQEMREFQIFHTYGRNAP
jgi:hypothetical protein